MRVTFRFGLVVDQVCRSIEVSPDEINAKDAWVYCVYGVDEQSAVESVTSFNIEKVRKMRPSQKTITTYACSSGIFRDKYGVCVQRR